MIDPARVEPMARMRAAVRWWGSTVVGTPVPHRFTAVGEPASQQCGDLFRLAVHQGEDVASHLVEAQVFAASAGERFRAPCRHLHLVLAAAGLQEQGDGDEEEYEGADLSIHRISATPPSETAF